MEIIVLSTADVARLFNVTETTVKRWADEGALCCQRTLGGHRKFLIKHVIEFAEKNNLEPLGVLKMPPGNQCTSQLQLAIMERDLPLLVDAFFERALSPERHNLAQFLSYLYEHKIPLWQIYDGIIKPAMQRIGEAWQQGKIGIALEHQATYATLDALSRLQARIHTKPSNGKTAILACLGEERHEIGLRCASYLI